ncbi:50S ribosomal protein L25/general stress protein Ctc [Lusitaniella coriacea LEGE 07157]|uniref:Large ribosomal subunit protein bL25 n=1 Tax=Lusitaniella coriacea LEGE 07157 TaxID=945747 RepID=A0A8J7JBI4_9CYAN|nr:50S ribosomal protein L25/general stress protein Ctc [Lusitaniella coriacea]MBE9116995.1 50S ribosomal protein L25/general stress protein Ctc [Lusitaniella coriacea LEGE 07157]
MSITIECQKRPDGSKPRALRREGLIPAALYGHKGTESVSLTLKAKEAENLLKAATINNTLIDVSVPEMSWTGKALIRDVQSHPWKRTLYHLSFFAVAGHGSLEVVVPVNLIGTAPGVKLGGILEQSTTEMRVSCLAGKIPESIEIDISKMETGDSLAVSDVAMPEGVDVLEDPETVVVSIVVPSKPATPEGEEEEEAEVAEEPAIAE